MSGGSEPLSYRDALRALQERGRFGIRLGLGRTRALLRELGDPHVAIRGALVGGTNGKGSVLALAASGLRAAGLRAGETPKPHLVTYRERLQLGGVPVDAATFARVATEVLPAAERVERRLGPPTEFELLTAMMFRWFAEQRVDLAVVEVGLGGRLDATNVWDGGVAGITNVALDHMDRLGSTVEAIAREKAAIVKRNNFAVTGASGSALAIIRRRSRRMSAPLAVVGSAPLLEQDRAGIVVRLPSLGETRVGLHGRHQAANVTVADALLDALGEAGIAEVPPTARLDGYRSVRWPGRLELLDVEGRDVLLDGAHNPAGAAALARALDDLRPHLAPGRLALVMAVMADKDVDGVVAGIAQASALREARIICTGLDAPRALPAGALAARWQAVVPGAMPIVEADPVAAVRKALEDGSGPVVVAGSLYLVGAVRAHLVDDPALRDPTELP